MSHRFGDEEMGKKDDDHHRANGKAKIPPGPDIRSLFRLRRRRVIQWIVVITLFYMLFKNMPTNHHPSLRPTYVDPSPARAQTPKSKPVPDTVQQEIGPDSKPPKRQKKKNGDEDERYYDGDIKFYGLNSALQTLLRFDGQRKMNKNVLFAAASLKSVSALLPIACEMGRWRRSHVHFVLMGRDPITWKEIMSTNAVDDDCKVYYFDARPDYSKYSTDLRMEISVFSALKHLEDSMHPQACIIDGSDNEEAFFLKGFRSQALNLEKTVIELPGNAAETMMWFTRLDSGSLQAWHKADLDILIQAPQASSGSLIKLLDSLQTADYTSSRPPRLTIEVPVKIDHALEVYLEYMKWPPVPYQRDHGVSNFLSLRHRISSRKLDPVEASIRTLELFYPAHSYDSHVLLLSPQVQLSPLWFQYAKYALLEYKYAAYRYQDSESLLGIALTIPSTYPNHSSVFNAPTLDANGDGIFDPKLRPTQFLYQAPTSHAAIYFGDRWKEFQSFLSRRIVAQETATRAKRFSKAEPAWMEYLLELVLARGYGMIYPGWTTDSIAVVHNELAQAPEEFSDEVAQAELETSKESVLSKAPSILSILPGNGDLPELPTMPFVSIKGELMEDDVLRMKFADQYAATLATEVGGCKEPPTRRKKDFKGAKDLFCTGEDEPEEEEEAYEPAPAPSLDNPPSHSDKSRNKTGPS